MINSTQSSIEIAGVKDGIIILRDGSYRIILRVIPSNFALKSEQEQNSIIFQYQGFLNSLHFPIEIVIRSKKLDLAPYLEKINKIASGQSNELIKYQAEDYVDFVSKLIDLANIMQKMFFVAIPYNPLSVTQVGLIDKLFPKKNTKIFDRIKISDQEFTQNTDKIKERAGIVASGLASLGLHCMQLSSEEIISTFYQIYNPGEANKERLADIDSMTSPIIQSETETNGMTIAENPDKGQDNMIDNGSLVEQKQKEEAEIRKLESENQADRQMKSPEDAVQASVPSNVTNPGNETAPSSVNPNPMNPNAQNVQPNSAPLTPPVETPNQTPINQSNVANNIPSPLPADNSSSNQNSGNNNPPQAF